MGGNSRTALIINCSPASINCLETISTLRFGTRAKKIANVAKINIEMSIPQLKLMLESANIEIERLQSLVQDMSLNSKSNTTAFSGSPLNASVYGNFF